MRKRFRIRAEAQAEIVEAFNFYNLPNPERGQRFLTALDAALDYIEDFPFANAVRFDNVRRSSIRGFSFALLYTVDTTEDEQDVLVTACVHERSDPQKWRVDE